MDPQAINLNETIQKLNKNVLDLLSERGKSIFFPKLGILSQSAQAKGKNINATIGEAIEDDGFSMHLSEFDKLIKLPLGSVYPYAPSFGKKELRDSWKEFIYRKNPSLGAAIISTPIVTCGLTHGISMSGYLFVDEGDTVVIPDLFWENYSLIFENAFKGKVVTFPLFKNGGFNIEGFSQTLDTIKGKIVLLLNFPNNPTGYTPLVSEINLIVDAIHKQSDHGKSVVALIDDAYFGLVYEDDVYTESIFTQLCNLDEKVLAVKLDGATKEDYVWGFRVGFLSFGVKNGTPELYEALENKTAGAVRGNISNVSNLSQSLLSQAYFSSQYEADKKEKFATLKSRYETIIQVLEDKKYLEYFSALPFNSGYFMCVELNSGLNAESIRQILLDKYSTGVIVFGNLIRLAFSAVPKSKITELIENIYMACSDYNNQKQI
jgi:aspartate/methionine/tyrosine aminotransferase